MNLLACSSSSPSLRRIYIIIGLILSCGLSSIFAVDGTLNGYSAELLGNWLGQDLGVPSNAGSASESEGVIAIQASGADIWGTSDSGYFVSQGVRGDCEIIARVNSLAETNEWAKAGLMLRESLDADARNVYVAVRAANGITFQRRTSTGGSTISTKIGVDPSPGVDDYDPPYWLRLVRVGNDFSAWFSEDGIAWTQLGATENIAMGANLYLGMAVTSHDAALTTTALFDSITVINTRSTVTVASIAELQSYAAVNATDVTMTAGTYWLTGPSIRPAPHADYPIFLDLSGVDSNYDFTGVILKVDTRELAGYGRANGHGDTVRVLQVSGANTTVDGLTLEMVHLAYNGIDAYGDVKQFTADWSTTLVELIGSGVTVKNCQFTTGGSYPYGYGDAFGKGGRPENTVFIDHRKQSGIRIGKGATGVTVDHVILNMRSFGHGIFMQEAASNIALRNCSVLGDDLASSNSVIAHPQYQLWGAATYGELIPPDIYISRHEDAIRVYGASETYGMVDTLTVEACRIERMRDGLATGDMQGALIVTDTEIYGCEQGFTPSAYGSNFFSGCKGDAANGPLVFFRRSASNVEMEVELAGATAPTGVWPIALISGVGNTVTLTRTAPDGLYPQNAYVMTSQYWREWRHRPNSNIDELAAGNVAAATRGNRIINQTGQLLILGVNATGNSCESDGGVLNKGSNNTYTGQTVLLPITEITDTWGTYTFYSGQLNAVNTLSLGGTGADLGTTVQVGAQLNIAAGLSLTEGNAVILSGDGVDGTGALYTDGALDSSTRLNLNGGIELAGNTSIGVGVSGSQFLVGPITGTGDLTKKGGGHLAMENGANSFAGALIVEAGSLGIRGNKFKNNAVVRAGATVLQISDLGVNQLEDHFFDLDGTLDLNGRSSNDTNTFTARISGLTGTGLITSTSTAALQTLYLKGSMAAVSFDGTISGNVSLVKEGIDTQQTLNGTLDCWGPMKVRAGELEVNGTITTRAETSVESAATLSGGGRFIGKVMLHAGGKMSPGSGVGKMVVETLDFEGGGILEIELSHATGSEGNSLGWDLLQVDGVIERSGAEVEPMLILIAGAGSDFDNSQSATWTILRADSGLSSLSDGDFVVDAAGFAPSLDGGVFSVEVLEQQLNLIFTPSAFAIWKAEHGLDASLNYSDDPNANGISLGLEFAFGMSPMQQRLIGLPRLVQDSETGIWIYSYFRARSEVEYLLYQSMNLVDWTLIESNPGTIQEWVDVEFRPATADEVKQSFFYMHLQFPELR